MKLLEIIEGKSSHIQPRVKVSKRWIKAAIFIDNKYSHF
jgi:hypothetical protein